MKNKAIIITGLQSWDIPIGSNAIDIAKGMSKDNKVLYVNAPMDTMTWLRNRKNKKLDRRFAVLSGEDAPLRKINENLTVLDPPFTIWSVNGLPDGPLFDFVNKANNRKYFRYVKKTAEGLGYKNYIHFIDNDIYRSQYAKEYLQPELSVYYRRDNIHPYAYWNKHAPRLEPLLISKSDLVVCNSPQLNEYALQYNPNSYSIGQGVDLSAYDLKKLNGTPAAFAAIPEPRIGYLGDINSQRLDPDLIYALAQQKPDYSFVLTGGEDPVFKSHGLHQLKNVYFTGSITKDKVPDYMNAFTVCMNPQQVNEITIGNYPRKIDEYLALGKPVIATRTKTMELFKDHVYLCDGVADYSRYVEEALQANNDTLKKERIAFASSHSWENNVNLIFQHIENHLK